MKQIIIAGKSHSGKTPLITEIYRSIHTTNQIHFQSLNDFSAIVSYQGKTVLLLSASDTREVAKHLEELLKKSNIDVVIYPVNIGLPEIRVKMLRILNKGDVKRILKEISHLGIKYKKQFRYKRQLRYKRAQKYRGRKRYRSQKRFNSGTYSANANIKLVLLSGDPKRNSYKNSDIRTVVNFI